MNYFIKNIRKLLFLLLVSLFTLNISQAQTTIWSQDFTGLADGTVAGANGVISTVNNMGWSAAGAASYAEVRNPAQNGGTAEVFETRNGVITWESSSLDITGYSDITLEMLVSESGNLENDDNATISYSIDGGVTFIPFSSSSGNFGADVVATVTLGAVDLGGATTLIIRAVLDTNNLGEYINIDDISVVSNQAINITNTLSTCVDISGGDFTFDVDYTAVGTLNAPNIFNVELSDAAGDFTGATVIGIFTSTTLVGTISSTIPAATPIGTGYRVRVVSSDAAITGADNGTDINIFNTQDISIAPTGNQNVAINSTGAALTASPSSGTSGSIQWGYRSISLGAITNFAPAETALSYTPDGGDFPGTGTYYVVAQTQACGTASFLIVSNEVQITIISPIAFNQVGGNVFADDNNDGIQTLPADVGEVGVTVNLYEDTNNDGVLDGGDVLLQTAVTDGSGNYNFDVTTSTCVRVANDNDDREEDHADGSIYTGSSDLELIDDGGTIQAIGMIFRNWNTIPKGSTIISSYLEFVSDASYDSEEIDLTIQGELVAGAIPTNPNDLSGTDFDISGRATTGASTNWQILANADDWANNEVVTTPDLAAIITEITSADSWASGNNIVMMINNGDTDTGDRRVDSYNTDGGNNAPLLCITYVPAVNYLVQVDRSDLPAGNVLTTSSATLLVSSASVTAGTAQDNNFGYTLDDNTIVNFADLCMDISGGAYNFTVDYQLAGSPNYNVGNTLTLQLSNTSGSFVAPLNVGTLNTIAAAGTINGIIPFGTAAGSNYRLRVVSSDPAIDGSDNGTDIRIFDDVSLAIAPTSAQAFAINTIGAPVVATPSSGTSGSLQWGYRSTSLGAITNFAPAQTNTTYTPAGADFPGEGTFFLVAMTQPCAGGAFSVISNEVEITLTSAIIIIPYTISGNVFFDVNADGINNAGDIQESGTTVTMYADTNGNGVIDGGDASLLTTTTDASGNYSFSILSSTCVRVSSGNDDAEEDLGGGGNNLTSSDLELIDDGGDQAIGMLFRNVNIPNGATITSSAITFVADANATNSAAVLTIQGELAASPLNLDGSNSNITGRTVTTTSVAWTLTNLAADNWVNNVAYETPSVNGIIGEITSLGGWVSGNNIVMMINHDGGDTGSRRVDSYNGDAPNAPLLCIEYISGTDYLIQVDRTGFPAGHTLTTTSATIFVGSATAVSGAAQNINFAYTNVDNNITNFTDVCMDISGGAFNFTVDYFLSGGSSYTAGNILTLQLSNSTGGFVGATDIGTVTTSSATGTISGTIPFGTTVGTAYRIRINSSAPADIGTDNGTDIRIFDDASLTIAPTGAQAFTTAGAGALLTSTAGAGTSGNIQWAYRTISSGATVNFVPPITTPNYTPTGADFPSAGTYYLVATTQPCSTASYTIISNEVEIVITNLANTITTALPECIDVSTASYMLDLDFDGGGGYNVGNDLSIELSNTTGGFVGATTIGTLSNYTFSSGTITITIPMGQAFSTAYRMRLVSTDPAFAGADNANNITIFNEPNITVAPLASQSFDNLSSGVAVTATTGNGTNGLVRWYYRTVPGGALNDFTPAQTGNTYTPYALNFPGVGTYYMVAATVPCGTVLYNAISTEIEIIITAAPNSISGNVFLDLNSDGTKDFNDKGQAAIRMNLYRDNNGDGVIDGGDTQLSTTLTDAVGNYSFSAGQIQLCTQLSSSADDAEQIGGTTNTGSSDLELVSDGGVAQNIGLRFQGVPVPAGVAIISAYLEFTVDDGGDDSLDPSANLTINGELIGDATQDFAAQDINGRTLTAAAVPWNIPANTPDWVAFSIVTSTDITAIITEITALPGWAAGNDMVMTIGGFDTGAAPARTVMSFDNNGLANAPSLCIVYAGLNYLVEIVQTDLGPGATLTVPASGIRAISGADVLAGSGGNDFGYDGETTGCYAIADSGNDLYIINRFTGENYYVGDNGVGDIESMAIDVFNDKVYATNGGELGSIDPLTGVYSTIGGGAETIDGSAGAIAITDIDGLTMDPFAGILYGSNRRGSADIFFQIDIGTGLVIRDAYGAGIDYVEITGAGVGNDIDDFMINPFSGIMYAANSAGGSTYSSQLVTIDYKNPNAGAAVLVGSFDNGNGGANYDIEGIGSSDCGAVYVTSGNNGNVGQDNSLFSVSTGTGAASLIGAFIGGGDFESSDCLFAPANRLLGTVADDTNGNGIRDGAEGGLANVTLSLYLDQNDNDLVDAGDILLQQTATDANGEYIFKVAGVVGNFVIQVDQSDYPADYVATTDDVEDESYLACSLGTDFPNNNFGARNFNILPITLIKFTAVLNEDNDVLLEWITADETDNAFFTIERSRDWQDPTTFTPILTVEGNGTTYRQNNYSAIDYELLEGTYYYRLKQTDIDGTFTYSKIVAIQIKANPDQEKEITLFPNPLGNQNLNFKLKGFAPNQNLNILIYDTMGRLVFAKDMNILANVVEIPTREHLLAAGAYVVRIISGDKTFYKKLIVSK